MTSLGKSGTQAGLPASVDWPVLLNVILASFLVSVFVHELAHILWVAHPVRLCIHFSEFMPSASVCCFSKEDVKGGIFSLEMIAFGAQFVVMLLWAILFRGVYIREK